MKITNSIYSVVTGGEHEPRSVAESGGWPSGLDVSPTGSGAVGKLARHGLL
ncbi:hypothetical protein [Streptomyces sp. NPDC001404]|uniref:hypothetical protein n=1 Tax=Streptomyces sp. NPDC001404 TaxID=3364571 RepID=UPI003678BA63